MKTFSFKPQYRDFEVAINLLPIGESDHGVLPSREDKGVPLALEREVRDSAQQISSSFSQPGSDYSTRFFLSF